MQLEHVEAGAFAALDARHELVLTRSISARDISRGTWLCGVIGQRRGGDERPGAFFERLVHRLPSMSLRGAFAAGMAELHADLRLANAAWMKSTMRFQAASCSSFHKPVQPCVMRASRRDASHLGEDQARAAQRARAVDARDGSRRGTPSSAEYMHIGETTTRLSSVISRKRKGWNMGGKGRSTSTAWP